MNLLNKQGKTVVQQFALITHAIWAMVQLAPALIAKGGKQPAQTEASIPAILLWSKSPVTTEFAEC